MSNLPAFLIHLHHFLYYFYGRLVYSSINLNLTHMKWPLLQKILFRFLVIYATLFCLSNQFFTTVVFNPIWQKIVPWFADKVLQLEDKITVFTNGSGDTTFNYVSLLLYGYYCTWLVLIVWSILDKARPNYEKALQWFLVLIRYYLSLSNGHLRAGKGVLFAISSALIMLNSFNRFGESSPMGLLWTFMGFSKGYTIFHRD